MEVEKPDFEELAKDEYNPDYYGWHGIYKMGCERIWNDHVIPIRDQLTGSILWWKSENEVLQARIKELESDNLELNERNGWLLNKCSELEDMNNLLKQHIAGEKKAPPF